MSTGDPGMIGRKTTITTQPYVRVDGQRKQMTHLDGTGTVRTLYVDVEFDRCATCLALLLPGDHADHARWHGQIKDGTDV